MFFTGGTKLHAITIKEIKCTWGEMLSAILFFLEPLSQSPNALVIMAHSFDSLDNYPLF